MSVSSPASANQLKLLFRGEEFFPALIQAINLAQREVLFETYIFALDEAGKAVKQALINAAQRGVQVRLILDWHGTGQNTLSELELEMVPAGVQLRAFNPWFKRGYPRLHRKLCVVDQEIGFVGGININDDWFCDFDASLKLAAPRWDFAAQVKGPLVQEIWLEMCQQWLRVGVIDLQGILVKRRSLPRLQLRLPRLGKKDTAQLGMAYFIVRDNFRNRRRIQNAYRLAMLGARQHILLATPYFAPGRKFIRAMAQAAQRGVKVTLLIGCGQYRLQDMVAQSFYPKLLKCGIEVVEYRKTQLHGKVAVIDGQWSTVGSSNCDGLSLFLNQEANLVVNDQEFSQSLQNHILQALQDGVPIKAEDYVDLAWYKRLWYSGAFWLYRGVMRIVTLGQYN